jgi:hypothetical protein
MPEFHEPIHDEPSGPVGDYQPVTVPDIRLSTPLWKQAICWLAGLAGLVLLVVGVVWYSGWSARWAVERSVREHYEREKNTKVTSISLCYSEGKYVGTLTTEDGVTLEVIAEVAGGPGRGRVISCQTRYTPEGMKALFRADMEAQNQAVRSIDVREDAKGRYVALIALENGDEYDALWVEEGGKPEMRYFRAQSTIEKWIHREVSRVHDDLLTALRLTCHAPERYSGTARGESGLDYVVTVEPSPENNTTLRLKAHPPPEQYERWVRRGLEKTEGVKVKAITLAPRKEGDYAGLATLSTGLVYEVRAGVPPAWRGTPRDGQVIWDAAMSPRSYADWVRPGLEARYRAKLVSLKFKPNGAGEYVGVAVDERGGRYRVRVGPVKDAGAKTEASPWPDIGMGAIQWDATPED